MSAKPSYLGLLNAIAVAERQAADYLGRWADTTTDPEVRATLRTIALREAEHGLAFAKRIDELGYGVIDKPDPTQAAKLKAAGSTKLTDREKFERFRLGTAPANGQRDVFDGFFENKDIDVVTGALLGRYIAEERDSGRMFASCYTALCSPKRRGKAKAKTPVKGRKQQVRASA